MSASALRVVMGGLKDDVWISDDPLRNDGGTSIGVTLWGLGETLTRVSRTGDVAPWLAESIRQLDPRTWHVRLRRGARFWDATPVTPISVAASFAHSREVQKDIGMLLDGNIDTRVVDEHTLEFVTEEPIGHFAAALAHPQMIVHAVDGHNLTGPYRPVTYQHDRELVLQAFADHWAGKPRIPQVKISVVRDVEARIQALESDEADLIYAFPPEDIDRLEYLADQYEVRSWPSMRMHSIQLNCLRPPFGDPVVRRALWTAIDRGALVHDVLRGHGAPTATLTPPWSELWSGDVPASDPPAAARMLESAGWIMGADGVRHNGQHSLAFTIYTPTGPVLAMRALAEAIAEQVRAIGFAVTPQEVASLSGAIKDGAYTAALRTGYSQLTGDPYFWLKLWVARDGRANPGPSYFNPELERLLADYARVIEPDQRRQYRRRIDALLTAEVPHVLLLFVPLILVARKGVLPQELVGDPNNEYFVDGLSHAFAVA